MASSNASAPERLRSGLVLLAAAAVLLAGAPAEATQADAPPGTPSVNAQAASPSGANDLSALLGGMRSASGVVAEFTETKELALLSAPLEASGTIYFLPPDRLVRVVTSPGRSRLVVNGDKVRFEEETGNRAFDLSASPMARQLIDSFVVLFNGDEARLKELYEIEFRADGTDWRLHLVPKSTPLDRMIASFDLRGSGAHIDEMIAVEPDGDRTVTRYGATDARHVFSASEIAQLFGAPGS